MARKKDSRVFSKEELNVLNGDLIKIARSFKDGHMCGLQELDTVITRVTEKDMHGKGYKQVVYD